RTELDALSQAPQRRGLQTQRRLKEFGFIRHTGVIPAFAGRCPGYQAQMDSGFRRNDYKGMYPAP
ncbi:MAG: hypothetical protein KGJ17_09500, partial [Gammaproteobacteria bacterium]|nr:hypothetical protein [Gammaproteobacteria bacterium]